MIYLQDLHTGLHEIFFGKPPNKDLPEWLDWDYKKRYIVPLQGNFFIPTMDVDEESATWIGFIPLELRSLMRASIQEPENLLVKNLQVKLRLTFTGPEAEKWACSTLFWEHRQDVKEIFEGRMYTQINYNDRRVYTKPMDLSGDNDQIVWVTDLLGQSFIAVEAHQGPWIPHIPGDGGVVVPA